MTPKYEINFIEPTDRSVIREIVGKNEVIRIERRFSDEESERDTLEEVNDTANTLCRSLNIGLPIVDDLLLNYALKIKEYERNQALNLADKKGNNKGLWMCVGILSVLVGLAWWAIFHFSKH